MEILIGIGLFIPLFIIDKLMFYLIKKLGNKHAISLVMVSFVISMMICLLYTITVMVTWKELESFQYMMFVLGVLYAIIVSTVYKTCHACTN